MKFDLDFLKNTCSKIFNTDSPSGYTTEVVYELEKIITEIGYKLIHTPKGNSYVVLDGLSNAKTICTSAHLDTLGLMVRSINGNGTLSLTTIGGPIIPTLDGEYCRIMTRDKKIYSGTILSVSPSVHVYSDANSKERTVQTMQVRLDEKVSNACEVRKLGIENGDFIFIDPKFTIVNDFIKSRFIDDKISVCILLTLLKYLKENRIHPQYKTYVYFTVHEEVGHGAASIKEKIDEFVTIDMACVGQDLSGNEYAVSICAKDSSGPYDYDLTTKLIQIAKAQKLNYAVDIYPYYGSDVSSYLSAGGDAKGALIGPGVSASHGMERTHMEAITNTLTLIYSYLIN